MGRLLIIAGIILIAAGLLYSYGGKIPFFGKLPGDITIEKPGFRLYFPLATSLLISVLISVILYLIHRFKQ